MNSFKYLITETENELDKLTKRLLGWEGEIYLEVKDNKFKVIKNYDIFIDTVNTDRAKERLKTLKLCQEIQDAKVNELKKEINKNPDILGKGMCEVIIDKIFEEETQAVEK